jgi:hypothetical protein
MDGRLEFVSCISDRYYGVDRLLIMRCYRIFYYSMLLILVYRS